MENLDLTQLSILSNDDLQIDIVHKALIENYPKADINKEMHDNEYVMQDFLDQKKLNEFLKVLNEKYPEE